MSNYNQYVYLEAVLRSQNDLQNIDSHSWFTYVEGLSTNEGEIFREKLFKLHRGIWVKILLDWKYQGWKTGN